MNRRLNRKLGAASFLVLLLAAVPGIAYTGPWSGPEGNLQVIVAEEPAGAHNHYSDGHAHGSGIQECRVGPSRCTAQPSFVSTTPVGGQAWALALPSLSHEISGPSYDPAFQAPVYRMKPPPRVV